MQATLTVKDGACEKLHTELKTIGCDCVSHSETSVTVSGSPAAVRNAARLTGVLRSQVTESNPDEPTHGTAAPETPSTPDATSEAPEVPDAAPDAAPDVADASDATAGHDGDVAADSEGQDEPDADAAKHGQPI